MGKITKQDLDREKSLEIIERVANGETVTEVCRLEGFPNKTTFYHWMIIYPEVEKAYNAAREMSAQSFEEEALEMARTLKRPNDFNGTKVKMYEVAMAQLRWSASRRDPRRYGQRGMENMIIPIQINTTLDIGQGGIFKVEDTNTYDFAAKIALDGPDLALQREDDPMDIPEAPVKSVIAPRPKPGSLPGKGHYKSEVGLRNTKVQHARREENARKAKST